MHINIILDIMPIPTKKEVSLLIILQKYDNLWFHRLRRSPNRFTTLQNSNTFNFNNANDAGKIATSSHINTESTNTINTSNVPPKNHQKPPIFIVKKPFDYKIITKSLISLILSEKMFFIAKVLRKISKFKPTLLTIIIKYTIKKCTILYLLTTK